MLRGEGRKEGGEGRGAQGRAGSPGKEGERERRGLERGAVARGAAGAAERLVCAARLPWLQWPRFPSALSAEGFAPQQDLL